MGTMQAFQRTPTGLELCEVEKPTRGPGEALVRVRMAGICNTDLELARGYMSFFGTLGHEFVGEVVDADNKSLVGARVAGEINVGCTHCEYCTRGLARHCPTRTVLGILGRDGCFAEYVVLPERNLHRVPERVSDTVATFIEPVAACFEVLDQIRISPRDRIAVLGDGKLGQLMTMVLVDQGFAPILVGKHADKLAKAKARGIATSPPDELERKSFGVVIEATGAASGMERAVDLVRPRGTLVLKSTYHGALSFDASPLVIDEITVVGSRCGPFQPAIASLASGDLPAESLVDAIFSLAEASAAFEQAAAKNTLKVQLRIA